RYRAHSGPGGNGKAGDGGGPRRAQPRLGQRHQYRRQGRVQPGHLHDRGQACTGAELGRMPMAKILIVEDNPANMKLASLLLLKAGHALLCAVDAETGLTMARAERPDLILMDIQLPGMDGLAATALLKKDPATVRIPVIALTAMAMKEHQEKTK